MAAHNRPSSKGKGIIIGQERTHTHTHNGGCPWDGCLVIFSQVPSLEGSTFSLHYDDDISIHISRTRAHARSLACVLRYCHALSSNNFIPMATRTTSDRVGKGLMVVRAQCCLYHILSFFQASRMEGDSPRHVL